MPGVRLAKPGGLDPEPRHGRERLRHKESGDAGDHLREGYEEPSLAPRVRACHHRELAQELRRILEDEEGWPREGAWRLWEEDPLEEDVEDAEVAATPPVRALLEDARRAVPLDAEHEAFRRGDEDVGRERGDRPARLLHDFVPLFERDRADVDVLPERERRVLCEDVDEELAPPQAGYPHRVPLRPRGVHLHRILEELLLKLQIHHRATHPRRGRRDREGDGAHRRIVEEPPFVEHHVLPQQRVVVEVKDVLHLGREEAHRVPQSLRLVRPRRVRVDHIRRDAPDGGERRLIALGRGAVVAHDHVRGAEVRERVPERPRDLLRALVRRDHHPYPLPEQRIALRRGPSARIIGIARARG
mmetsp:Transcript_12477/g.41095  ORF Transcript_12477/g.41095 Transcript_12477/m.41095 type:complete len:359 (+) Transcript_12477:505-1581(+)